MGDLIRNHPWDETNLGPIDTWPQSLLTSINLLINSSYPMFIWWDEGNLINFYNDAYAKIIGGKHPQALGAKAEEVWKDIWDQTTPLVKKVFIRGVSVSKQDLPLTLNRSGRIEKAYFTFSFSPIFGEEGKAVGIFCVLTETTQELLSREQLKESEVRFKNLADTAPMYIAMADETGNAIYFNKPWLQFTGKKQKEMLGLGWLSTLHPEDAPKFEKDFKNAFKNKQPISEEYRFKRADGEYRWMLAIGAPRFTPDGKCVGYFGTYTDFHDLKMAQLEIEISELRFRTLIEKSPSAVQMVSEDGRIFFSSSSVVNVLGYSPEELANTGVLPYLHPDDMKDFFENFNELVKHPGSQRTFRYRVRHKNGSWAWVETIAVNHLKTPHIHALVGNFRNFTEQKEAEDRLRDSERKFRAFIDNIPNLAWIARPNGYRYWFNNRWYEYTGSNLLEMRGWGWKKVHDQRILPDIMKQWNIARKKGLPFETVAPLRGADGEFRPFLSRVIPIKSSDGKVLQWVGTNTDISEQLKAKEAEAEKERIETSAKQLALQHRELIELNKAKDEFISLASHQLRTPATGVKQFLGMLIEGYGGELSPAQLKLAERSYESNEREISIINDLLKVAQLDAGRMRIQRQMIDFSKFIEEIIDEHRSDFAERNQTIAFERPAKVMAGHADKQRVQMVLDNIIDNASKYSSEGKCIYVHLEQDEDKTIHINIRDEGVGISMADFDKIFDKFVRVDNPLSTAVGGSGLGLYLAKKIMDLHGGKITVASTPGKGTLFSLSLPQGQ